MKSSTTGPQCVCEAESRTWPSPSPSRFFTPALMVLTSDSLKSSSSAVRTATRCFEESSITTARA